MALKLCQNLRAYGGSAPEPYLPGALPLDPTRGPNAGPWTPPVIARATRSVGATLTSYPGRQNPLAMPLVRGASVSSRERALKFETFYLHTHKIGRHCMGGGITREEKKSTKYGRKVNKQHLPRLLT